VADATVPQQRHEESLVLRDERDGAQALPIPSRIPWLRTLVWAALVTLLGAFLVFGSVRVGAGNWNGRRMRVTIIWERFLQYLGDQGFSAPITALVILSLATAIAGSVWLLWLAFGLRDAAAPAATDDPLSK
jgi:hypothetical protein